MRRILSHKIVHIGVIFFVALIFIIAVAPKVFAAPPLSPYAPGETTDPSCAPSDANCTVTPPLAATTTLTAGSLLFIGNASGTVYQNNQDLFWDNINNRLGIGTTTPSSALTVVGGVSISGNVTTTDLVISGIAGGGAQCLHVNASGVVAGTGEDCGAGGGVTTTINGTQTSVFNLIGDGLTISSTVSGATTTFSIINPGWLTATTTINGMNGPDFSLISGSGISIAANDNNLTIANSGVTSVASSPDIVASAQTGGGIQFLFATTSISQFTNNVGYLLGSNNLSDVESSTAARENLDLGTAATYNFNDFLPSSTAYIATNTGDWAGMWQTYSPSYFQAALGYTPAHSGANSDITSLTGLTTPLVAGEGGTATTTALGSNAFTSIAYYPNANPSNFISSTTGATYFYPFTGNPSLFLTSSTGLSYFAPSTTVAFATTTLNGAAALAFHIIGDGSSVTSTVSGATTTFSVVNPGWLTSMTGVTTFNGASGAVTGVPTNTGNWVGTWQGVNSSTFYLASNPSGYITTSTPATVNLTGSSTAYTFPEWLDTNGSLSSSSPLSDDGGGNYTFTGKDGTSQFNLLIPVDPVSTYGYGETLYRLENASGTTQNLFETGAEGNLSATGTLSGNDYYFYNSQTGAFDIEIAGNDDIGLGGESMPGGGDISGANLALLHGGDSSFGTSTDLGYQLGVNGTFGVVNTSTFLGNVGIGTTNPDPYPGLEVFGYNHGVTEEVGGVDDTNFGFGENDYGLNNPSAPTPTQLIWTTGAEGNYSNTGVLSGQDFYLFTPQGNGGSGVYNIEVNGTDDVGIGGTSMPGAGDETGAVLYIDHGGNVGIGTTTPSQSLTVGNNNQFTVSSTGTVTAAGNINATGGFSGPCLSLGTFASSTSGSCNADVAESYPTFEPTVPGDVVAIPPTSAQTIDASSTIVEIGRSRGAVGERVLGVVSTNPGLVFDNGSTFLAGANDHYVTATETVVALTGRVSVFVSLENGPIAAGDELAASADLPGIAVRAVAPGNVIGIALQAYNVATPSSSQIMVFVEPHWSLGNLTTAGGIASSSWAATSSISSGSNGGVLDQFTLYIESALQKLGLAVANGIATVQQLFAQKVTTNELCVGTTCVNQQQLSQLLANANGGSDSGSGSSSGGGGNSSGGGNADASTPPAPANITTGTALDVALTSPATGDTVSSTIELDVNITLAPSTTISRVDYQLDGTEFGQGLWTNNPEYSYNWNTATVSDGAHTVTVMVTDSTGATSTESVTVTVDNNANTASPAVDSGSSTDVSASPSSTDVTDAASTTDSTDAAPAAPAATDSDSSSSSTPQ